MAEFKVGDLVRVKSWEQMEKEFGLSKTRQGKDCVKCKFNFVNDMKYLSGETFTIKDISMDGHIMGLCGGWNISTDMLEHVKEEGK